MTSELRAPETFESWNSYWQFRFETSRKNRYIRSEKSERFLRAVADTSADRAIEPKKGRIFWRARIARRQPAKTTPPSSVEAVQRRSVGCYERRIFPRLGRR
jgi:hypothetical protein